MLHDIFFLIIGLCLILAGGNFLTDGAEAIARRFRISPLVIGLTVVAFGSSTPDLAVSLFSTIEGKSQLALGDVVGANIFDLLLVVGIMAIISPIPVSADMRKKDLPMLFLSGVALFICGDDRFFDSSPDTVSRTDGLLLLSFFVIFMCLTWSMAQRHNTTIPPPQGSNSLPRTDTTSVKHKPMKMWLAIVCIAGGLTGLVAGGNWIVDGASGIARRAGLSEAMIGLTVVAFGSSVPDLATSVIAAIKKQPGIALGNVVGSCVFNVFLAIGICAVARPLDATRISLIDFGTLTAAGAAIWIFGLSPAHKITRAEGWGLTIAYLTYMAYVVLFNSHP